MSILVQNYTNILLITQFTFVYIFFQEKIIYYKKQLLIKVRIVLRFFLKLPASGDFPTFFIYFYLISSITNRNNF